MVDESEGYGMTVIERQECPEHGNDTGLAYTEQGVLRCGAFKRGLRRCGKELAVVEYVPRSQIAGAVDLLRQSRGYVADHVAAHPGDELAARLWSEVDAAINATDEGR